MTKWKILPREQCQGKLYQSSRERTSLMLCARHTQFRGQLHHSKLKLRRELEEPENLPQQAKSRPRVYTQARMAAQLAYLHQRDYLFVPHEPFNLREQYVYSEAPVGGSVRLLGGPDDIGEDQES